MIQSNANCLLFRSLLGAASCIGVLSVPPSLLPSLPPSLPPFWSLSLPFSLHPCLPFSGPFCLAGIQSYKETPSLETGTVYLEKANCGLLIMTQCNKCRDKSY